MHALKRKSPLRRIVLASAATVSGMVLLLSMKPHSTPGVAVAAPSPAASSGASASAGSGGTGASASGGPGTTKATKTVTGESVQTRYGPVQVRITLRNGKLTDVTAVTYPQDNPRDQEINSYAVPQLTREAMAAQSASIDTVSGATYTSDGYRQSLQSALDSASR
ncbi:FMN-binding protein [Streptomyces sp. TP-A0356]|uniref:FMN-binding protein n=1 Tax=Streptomyces sp. TP-A0356 TaxID=1359208 RepID=UPI0006E37961|nr:FMN-binding protein [Streptomyces sp. TP-A0356]